MTEIRRKTGSYGEGLAKAYDSLMREDCSYAEYARYIDGLFVERGIPRGSLVADLGCGAGALCIELAKLGYEMIGVDNSPQMLSEARGNAIENGFPDMLFLEQDIEAFELYGTVAAFVSTIDSLNYITSKRGLTRVFKLVSNYLEPGGLFVFDLNTDHKLASVVADNVFYDIGDDFCYIWESRYDKARKISTFDLTFFTHEGDGRWHRFDEIHRQRAYRRDEIEAAAEGAGLRILGEYAFMGRRKPSARANKINYILQKNRAAAKKNGESRE